MENSAENRSDRPLAECEEKREGRRHFVKSTLAVGIGAACAAVPVYGGARMVLFPLQQTGLSGKEYPLTTLANIDETPRLYSVTDTATDAWVSSPGQPIGNVFIHKTAEGKVHAFQAVCPHAGCRIKVDKQKDPVTGEEKTLFFCPCHSDLFSLDGERLNPETAKSARSMDSLETRVDEEGRVFVKFQNFRLGCAEKSPV
ncbi:MAG: Rieske (2Fe-2S) protein [Thermoguttaceae bacterium]|jgi:nitrite reductase/ring-hydroxylating ferredoxin subunit